MEDTNGKRSRAAKAVVAVLAVAVLAGSGDSAPPADRSEATRSTAGAAGEVLRLKLYYQANGGRRRFAFLLLPSGYGPRNHPALPLVIAPHGSGPGPFLALTRVWGDLASRGRFAVVIPEGQGRELAHYSWGYAGQIDDLARMPEIVRAAVPWIRLDPRRVYALGGSMGGLETLLLVARHARLLAGAVAFDASVDLALRYRQFARLPQGEFLRELMRLEVGGPPDGHERAYAERSALAAAPGIASSGVPLQIWWSTRDELVVDQQLHSGRLFREIKRLRPRAPVAQVVGSWRHGEVMWWNRRLPDALRFLGLLLEEA